MEKELWGVKDVAEYLGCCPRYASNYMREKNCPTINKGKNIHMKVPKTAFIEWVNGGMK